MRIPAAYEDSAYRSVQYYYRIFSFVKSTSSANKKFEHQELIFFFTFILAHSLTVIYVYLHQNQILISHLSWNFSLLTPKREKERRRGKKSKYLDVFSRKLS